MSIVNNSLKLTINALALSFRQRLTKVSDEKKKSSKVTNV